MKLLVGGLSDKYKGKASNPEESAIFVKDIVGGYI